ncbi:hypothetical protein [Nonomuraea sp. 10N515B]|uniref:hypothetical protein n=1 Tax=Nonomuraea sp. 10N515B TaxID=3457422 RepID=UPI003FCC5140
MTKNSARKKEIRARQAATGEAYNAARRALDRDQDPSAAVWLRVTLEFDPAPDDQTGPRLLDPQDRAAVALAISGAWKYAKIPCPRAVVWPVRLGAERAVLLTRLSFPRPPAGGSVTAEELESLAAAARHTVVMRGRKSVTATAELAPAADVEEFGAHAAENGEHSPEIAERDWWRHALVRLTRDVTTGSPYTEPTHHRAGRVLDLWQTGSKDWPIDTTTWKTNLDVDLMGFVPDDAVTLVEVLEEMPPRLADPVEPTHARLARRWARAVALFANAAGDPAMTSADWVMVHDHRQEVTRAVQDQVTAAGRAEQCPDPELLRLAADILEQIVQQGASGYRWNVDSTRTVAADLRALAGAPASAGPGLRERLWTAEEALSTALQVDGAVGVNARLRPRERQDAEVRFGARLAAVLDAERAAQAGIVTTAEELGEPLWDDDLIRNGLFDLEGPYGSPDAALCEAENWDYAEVTGAWLDHAAAQLAGHGIRWDPATGDQMNGGPVHLPEGMSLTEASERWGEVYDGFGEWIADVVEQARDGAGQAPPDGIRPDTAPGARWITWSTA